MNKLLPLSNNFLCWFTFALLVGSCKCTDPYGGGTCPTLNIIYQNVKGQDMFDTDTPNHFKKDSITSRYLDSPIGFEDRLIVYGTKSNYYVNFIYYPNKDKVVDKKYIIKLNKTTYDTLTLTGDAALRKVVYNGKTIPPPSGSNDYPQSFYFTVVK